MTEGKNAATKPATDKPRTGKSAGGRRKLVERIFERALWESSLLMLIGVVFSVLMSAGAFYITAVDAFQLFSSLAAYSDNFLQP